MDSPDEIAVEVAYALPHRQALVALSVPRGSTAMAAAVHSGLAAQFDDLDLEHATLGIHGHIVAHGHILREGDRVEIYRPLIADPKIVRRARALRVQKRKQAR